MSSYLGIVRIRRNFFFKLAAIVFVIGIVIILRDINTSSSFSVSHGARLSVNIVPTQSDDETKQFRDDAPRKSERRTSSVQTLDRQKKTAVPGYINNLTDVFIGVKTTGKFHRSRVDLQIKTWFKLARDQTYIFTDTDDAILSSQTNGHTYNTNCKVSHFREDLCCKMAVEFDIFLESKKKWFCHVDDDTYVNVPALLRVLQLYRFNEDWYIGRPSLLTPLKMLLSFPPEVYYSYWFATGGAGFCVSRGLALKMAPYVSNGKLTNHCRKIRLPDDCTVGFIISYYLNTTLTIVRGFHSHLESLVTIKRSDLSAQVTFSYSVKYKLPNTVDVPGFNVSDDPTRFLSLHCYLFPETEQDCPLNQNVFKFTSRPNKRRVSISQL